LPLKNSAKLYIDRRVKGTKDGKHSTSEGKASTRNLGKVLRSCHWGKRIEKGWDDNENMGNQCPLQEEKKLGGREGGELRENRSSEVRNEGSLWEEGKRKSRNAGDRYREKVL